MANSEEIAEFLDGPLIKWIKSCVGSQDLVLEYNDLIDGVIFYQVLLQIDPEPAYSGVTPTHGNTLIRIKNLEIILKNLRELYKDELNQTIIVVPNVVRLGTELDTPAAREDLRLLILLLLACAVQCPNKEIFIERIKELPFDVQHSIVDHIKQFTDTPLMVLHGEQESSLSSEVLLGHLRHLVKERDDLLTAWANAAAGEISLVNSDKAALKAMPSNSECHHLAVEVADWKSKLRKQRQELEEKTEALNECRDELELQRAAVARLRLEVADVVQDARSAKAYRDELDVMREKADRADRLESELGKYKAKMRDIEFFKTRVEELRDDNRVLMETREMLEGQLERARRRGDRVVDLEAEVLKLKQENKELVMERDAKDQKLEEQYAELAELQLLVRCTQTSDAEEKAEIVSEASESGENSLSSQLSNNATTRALRLELENHRLRLAIDNLKESAVREANAKLLEAEHQNKIMAIKMEQLEDQCKRLSAENKELEVLVTDASQDIKKLQESREVLRSAADVQQAELQESQQRLEKLQVELEEIKEKHAREVLRLEELEKDRSMVDEWKQKALLVPELENLLEECRKAQTASETQISLLLKDITKLKKTVEESHKKQDELQVTVEANTQERDQLLDELKSCKAIATRVHEIEQEREDLLSRTQISDQALSTLQNELVKLKVEHENLKSSLSRLGLDSGLLLDPCTTLATLLSLPALKDQIPAELRPDCQACVELPTLREELAHYQVLVSTQQSQITSLNAQHTAVQLANTQLAAEKEQLEEVRRLERISHERLLEDQTALQRLHEQLSSEHEKLSEKVEAKRQLIRSQQKEIQTLRDDLAQMQAALDIARADRKELEEKTISLKNLRDEHSKLKDDFRELYTRVLNRTSEFAAQSEEFKKVRSVAADLRIENAQLREQVTALNDTTRKLQLYNEKLAQANAIIEEDRRSVMDHASVLLAQYQELFNHSIEDNQHYHEEEKQFVDKLNELRRQKEKLEQKIMDHYRRSESTSNKKKGFGATLVRKVRKAGSELMNRSRRSLHEDSRASLNIQGSESGENESDTSFDDGRYDESGHLPRILQQQEAGTRQTVYEADKELGTGVANQPGLTVINKFNTTTVVTHSTLSSNSPSLSTRSQNGEEQRRKSRKDDIYFDYGCV